VSSPAARAEIAPDHTPPRPFQGWRVLSVCLTAQFLSASVTFAPFGAFVVPFIEEFGTTRAQMSSVFSIAFVGMGVLGPLVGSLLDRGHARRIMMTGLALNALALIAMSRATDLWWIGTLFCIAACAGAAFYGMTPSMWLATQWFDRRRGLALGVTVAGATLGTMIGAPVAAWLIEQFGWRDAVAIIATAALLLGFPLFARFAIARPADVGQFPDGDPAPEPDESWGADGTAPPGDQTLETGVLVRDPRLWLLALGFALIFSSPIVAMTAIIPFGEGLGFSSLDAAFFLTASGPFSILSKVGFGWASDRLAPRLAIWLVASFNALAWGLLLVVPNYTIFLVIGAIYGIGIGAAGPLQALILSRCFGPTAFGRVSGIGGLAGLPIIAGAPVIANVLTDSTGSYHSAFQLEVAYMIVGATLASLARIPKADQPAA